MSADYPRMVGASMALADMALEDVLEVIADLKPSQARARQKLQHVANRLRKIKTIADNPEYRTGAAA